MRERIRDVWSEMEQLQEEMDRLFREMWGTRPRLLALPSKGVEGGPLAMREFREPLVDVSENDKDITVTAEIPGVDKKDIEINIRDDAVEIKVEKKSEVKEEKKGYYRMERSYRGFYRALPLPAKVISDKAEAKYESGVLEIKVPKAEPKKGVKKLEVK